MENTTRTYRVVIDRHDEDGEPGGLGEVVGAIEGTDVLDAVSKWNWRYPDREVPLNNMRLSREEDTVEVTFWNLTLTIEPEED